MTEAPTTERGGSHLAKLFPISQLPRGVRHVVLPHLHPSGVVGEAGHQDGVQASGSPCRYNSVCEEEYRVLVQLLNAEPANSSEYFLTGPLVASMAHNHSSSSQLLHLQSIHEVVWGATEERQ